MAQKLSKEDIQKFIRSLGDDPNRSELRDTPRLFLEALEYCFSGYASQNLPSLLTKMENPNGDSLVVLKEISFFSFCEHHILPISGCISVGYVPDRLITTIGSIRRLINACTRQLQIQERICAQIAFAIEEALAPKGVIVYSTAKHMCMMQDDGIFDSTAKRGLFLTNNHGEVQEFFSLIK